MAGNEIEWKSCEWDEKKPKQTSTLWKADQIYYT